MKTEKVLSIDALLEIIYPEYWEFVKDTIIYRVNRALGEVIDKTDIQEFDLVMDDDVLASVFISIPVLDALLSDLPSPVDVSELFPRFMPLSLSLFADSLLSNIETIVENSVEIIQSASYSLMGSEQFSYTFDLTKDKIPIGQFTLVIPVKSRLCENDLNNFFSTNPSFISNNNTGMSFILGALDFDEVSITQSNSFIIGKENDPLPGLLQISSNQFIPGHMATDGSVSLKKIITSELENNFPVHTKIPETNHALVKKTQEPIQLERNVFSDSLKLGTVQGAFSLYGEALIDIPNGSQISSEIICENGLISVKRLGGTT